MPERNLEKERSQKMRAGMKQRHKHLKLVATGITKQRGEKRVFSFPEKSFSYLQKLKWTNLHFCKECLQTYKKLCQILRKRVT